ncbi:hypothetical protein [Arthrobacter psychrochitiniphilus]|uniref:hypothetical protein n=1 Tax=Arthrobacter psychrochitiniphilus TaxID=291045 RepID=UPI003F7CC45F
MTFGLRRVSNDPSTATTTLGAAKRLSRLCEGWAVVLAFVAAGASFISALGMSGPSWSLLIVVNVSVVGLLMVLYWLMIRFPVIGDKDWKVPLRSFLKWLGDYVSRNVGR